DERAPARCRVDLNGGAAAHRPGADQLGRGIDAAVDAEARARVWRLGLHVADFEHGVRHAELAARAREQITALADLDRRRAADDAYAHVGVADRLQRLERLQRDAAAGDLDGKAIVRYRRTVRPQRVERRIDRHRDAIDRAGEHVLVDPCADFGHHEW